MGLLALQPPTFAAEKESDLGTTTLKNYAKVIRPPDVSKAELTRIKKVAVLCTSTLPIFGQVAGEYLTMKLRDLEYTVVEQSKVSETTVRELGKLDKQAGASGPKPDEIVDIIKIGKQLGLDAVVVGTVFEGRRQSSFQDESPARWMEKTVVATMHVQFLDIKADKVLLSVMLEYDKGESLTGAIDTLAKVLKDEAK
jgi:hypothetical protein